MELFAESALLLSSDTQQILYEKHAGIPYSLASVTKLMTIYLALTASQTGDFSLDGEIALSPESYAIQQPLGSSLMFLGPGQRVTGMDLLQGLAVSSGNDAAVAVAIAISGSISAFVEKMNQRARSLGYRSMRFMDPSGLHPGNMANSRDIASLALRLIHEWESMIPLLFSLKEFSYPREIHQAGAQAVVQKNRNLLLWDYPGADGLKTGYTEEAGYTLVATAKQGQQRLIAVLFAVPGTTAAEGSARRSQDARNLLDYGFTYFATAKVPFPPTQLPISGASPPQVAVGPRYHPFFTLAKGDHQRVHITLHPLSPLWAPVMPQAIMGELSYELDGYLLERVPLVAYRGAEKSGLVDRIIDWLRYQLRILRSADPS